MVIICTIHFYFQIIPPHDTGIQHSIDQNLKPFEGVWDIDKALSNPNLSDPIEEISQKYFAHLSASMLDKTLNYSTPIRFTVTAMHGVSHSYMMKAFEVCNFKVFFFGDFCQPIKVEVL